MPERIYKLQPNRTLALRGFDGLGAAAAIHSATATGLRVSGVFRDAGDFAVLVLHDADNFYEHPRIKYLPDFEFAGLKLQFDLRTAGLMPLDSLKYPTISWPYLEALRKDGTKQKILLRDYAVRVGGEYTTASSEFTIQDNGLQEYDRLTLWYQNLAFDYIVPKVAVYLTFRSAGPGTVHTVKVVGTSYQYTERAGDSDLSVAQGVASALAGCVYVSAAADAWSPGVVLVRAKRDDGIAFDVFANGSSFLLHGVGASAIAQDLAQQINAAKWNDGIALIPLRATASGATIHITADRPGVDGNMLTMYALSKSERLRTSEETAVFSGGKSEGVWRVTIDFSACGLPDPRMMWLTFAPALAQGSAFQDLEWEAEFTNWSVTGPEETKRLRVAGPGSVRVEENDSWCKYTGNWDQEIGFFSGGTARFSRAQGSSVTVKYSCTSVHDLYLGTCLYSKRIIDNVEYTPPKASIRLDGDAATTFDCYVDTDAEVNTRRLIRSGVAPGEHTVTITQTTPGLLYLDFIEAAVASDVPDPLPANPNVSPALDYSTDHTYKLPPARIHWNFDQLGYAAPMNEYIGVFWWNQRRRVGGQMPQVQIRFSGSFAAGDAVFLAIGDSEIGKSVFPADTPASIARHFALFLNGYSVAVWAKAEGDVLTITSRSTKAAYQFPVTLRKEAVAGSTGEWTMTGWLKPPAGTSVDEGTWTVDPEQTPAVNRGAQDWHADMFRECAGRNREIVVATSMELVNPPDGFASVFPDGKPVITDVGFGNLKSTHCAFTDAVRSYQQSVYMTIANLMSTAGLVPNLQCGEFLWWFFSNRTEANPAGGMGYYHPSIRSDAQSTLGRSLTGFVLPTDDPTVNNTSDAAFLRARLRDHVQGIIAHVRASHPAARFEVLFPYDVNHPEPAGIHRLGGRLNRFVNFPAEWASPASAGFDRLKMEALDFGAWSKNLDLARTAIDFPFEQGWPASQVRHLVPIFRPGYPWEKEVEMALAAGIPVVNLWAWDHVCIYGLAVAPRSTGRSAFMGG